MPSNYPKKKLKRVPGTVDEHYFCSDLSTLAPQLQANHVPSYPAYDLSPAAERAYKKRLALQDKFLNEYYRK